MKHCLNIVLNYKTDEDITIAKKIIEKNDFSFEINQIKYKTDLEIFNIFNIHDALNNIGKTSHELGADKFTSIIFIQDWNLTNDHRIIIEFLCSSFLRNLGRYNEFDLYIIDSININKFKTKINRYFDSITFSNSVKNRKKKLLCFKNI